MMHRPGLLTLVTTLAITWLAFSAATPARSGSTDPTLAIGQLRAQPVGAASLLELTGIFGFDDIIQVDFPVTVVVWQGDSFVRLRAGAVAQSGTFAGLADGLQTSEIAALESAGADDAGAEILELAPNKLLMALPPTVVDGNVNAVLYVQVPTEGTFLSNAVSTTLVGVGAGS